MPIMLSDPFPPACRAASAPARAAPQPRRRWIRAGLAMALSGALAACATTPATGPDSRPPVAIDGGLAPAASARPSRDAASIAARNFISVMDRMGPAVRSECLERRRTPINCEFQFVVDDRSGLEPNAFQTVDARGRPVIGFTLSLLAAARNTDELAFVVGHEASHHILNHISQKSSAAIAGAVILTGIVAAAGADPTAIRSAQQMGANVGARYYSKEWELQADYLGAIIAKDAGYDPVNGARFFQRMPDPGNRVLGSHPSRAQREAAVARAMDDLRTGRTR